MKINVYKNLKSIKNKYEKLYNSNPYRNVFQSYDFLKNRLATISYNRFLRFIKFRSKIRFLEVVNDNNETILILPVEVSKKGIKTIPTYDYYDLVCGNFKDEEIYAALNYIMEQYNSDLTFYNVTDKSKLFSLMTIGGGVRLSTHGCGKIVFPNWAYEDYYQSLTKSSRQNLRTAYNRLGKDNLQIKMEYYFDKLPKKIFKQSKQMYIKRFFEKNPKKRNIIKYLMLQLFEPVSKICAKTKDSFNAILKINDKPAAIMSGFMNENSIIIPRLVYNSDFGKYSPGIILINETIKHLIKEQKVDVLDLGLGEENYKFVMGAKPYVAYDIELKRK